MDNKKDYTKQGERLENAFRFIIQEYFPNQYRKDMMESINAEYETDYNASYFSKLIKGERPIPDKLLRILQKEYYINPDYILCKSDSILDTLPYKFNHFLKFVDRWFAVFDNADSSDSQEAFLHIEIDRNFYDFILSNSHFSLYQSGEDLNYKDTIIYDKSDLKNKKSIPEDFMILPLEKGDVIRKYDTLKQELTKYPEIYNSLKDKGLVD